MSPGVELGLPRTSKFGGVGPSRDAPRGVNAPVATRLGPHRDTRECTSTGLDLVSSNLADAAQQASRVLEKGGPANRVLVAWISLPALKNLLQRIIYDPPALVELGYEANGGCTGRARVSGKPDVSRVPQAPRAPTILWYRSCCHVLPKQLLG
jgi:hypothetical protein